MAKKKTKKKVPKGTTTKWTASEIAARKAVKNYPATSKDKKQPLKKKTKTTDARGNPRKGKIVKKGITREELHALQWPGMRERHEASTAKERAMPKVKQSPDLKPFAPKKKKPTKRKKK